MRVAQVLLRYDAPGGVETHVRELSRELRKSGDEVKVYASDLFTEDGWVRRPDASRVVDGIPVERFPTVKKLVPGLTLPLMPGLVGALDRDRPDVIHAHSHRYGHVLEAALVAEARGLPLVVTTHYHPADPWEPSVKKGLLRIQDHLFGATAYRTARVLIVETEREARALQEFAPASKVRIIPPGIDLDLWSKLPSPEAARARTGLPQRYLLFAGRLARNKGLPTLIEAWAGLPAFERPPLVLAGQDWGMRKELEALAKRREVATEVRFLGSTEPETYRAVFAGASAFVLPSEYEAFGLVLLEAMAAGLPIVATRVGGVPEVVQEGKTGLLVPAGAVQELRAALRTVLTDPPRARELADAGHARVESQYSWKRTCAEVRALYREVVGGGTGTAR